MKPFYCANCNGVVNLDKHGRCEICSSDAVDIAVRPCVTEYGLASAFFTVEELERMMEEL